MKKRRRACKKFTLHSDVYGLQILVLCGMPRDKSDKILRKWFGEKDLEAPFTVGHGTAYAFHNHEDATKYALWFEKIPGAGMLSHECFHLVFRIFQVRGIELSESSQEAYAYFLDWIVRRIGGRLW